MEHKFSDLCFSSDIKLVNLAELEFPYQEEKYPQYLLNAVNIYWVFLAKEVVYD